MALPFFIHLSCTVLDSAGDIRSGLDGLLPISIWLMRRLVMIPDSEVRTRLRVPLVAKRNTRSPICLSIWADDYHFW
jgi:hypothetical protein